MNTNRFQDMRTLIVIPCLNEAAHIEAIVRQLSRNLGVLDALIIVADGGSTDGTQDIVARLQPEISGLVLLNNPKRLQAPAINLAVELYGEGRDYLIRIDAHGDYPDDYCQVLLADAAETGADSVVVGMKTVGSERFQRAAAFAQNSKLGNGGSKHRDGGGGQWVDHAHHALMRIAAFRAVGGYDENFSHNEDAELDHRLRLAGFRIWMTGKTYMIYYPRKTASSLFRQYLGYGRGRAKNLLKHRVVPKVRQAIPLAVVPVCIGALLSIFHWVFAVPFLIWATVCLGYGFWIAISERNPSGILAGIAAMIMHFAWSYGFWSEFLSASRRRTPA